MALAVFAQKGHVTRIVGRLIKLLTFRRSRLMESWINSLRGGTARPQLSEPAFLIGVRSRQRHGSNAESERRRESNRRLGRHFRFSLIRPQSGLSSTAHKLGKIAMVVTHKLGKLPHRYFLSSLAGWSTPQAKRRRGAWEISRRGAAACLGFPEDPALPGQSLDGCARSAHGRFCYKIPVETTREQ
jgi:hypothetical protein